MTPDIKGPNEAPGTAQNTTISDAETSKLNFDTGVMMAVGDTHQPHDSNPVTFDFPDDWDDQDKRCHNALKSFDAAKKAYTTPSDYELQYDNRSDAVTAKNNRLEQAKQDMQDAFFYLKAKCQDSPALDGTRISALEDEMNDTINQDKPGRSTSLNSERLDNLLG
jgi:hypothetical protein